MGIFKILWQENGKAKNNGGPWQRKWRERRRKDRSWLEDEEARGEFWPGAWRVRGCRRPAGAEGGGVSSFGPPPRGKTLATAREGRKEAREWRWMRKKARKEEDRGGGGRRGATSRIQRARGWRRRRRGDQRRRRASLMELLCFECWNMEIRRLTERAVEAHHSTETHSVDAETDKRTFALFQVTIL